MKMDEMKLSERRMRILTLSEMNKIRGGDGPNPPVNPPIQGGK